MGPRASDVAPFIDAFARRKVPLKFLEVDESSAREKYQGYALVLIRPDQHIAWRGRQLPDDALAIVDTITAANRTDRET